MTKTLALVAIVAGSLMAGISLQAQDAPKDKPAGERGGPGMRGRPNIDEIAKDLNLSEDQKTKLKTVLEEQQTKMQEVRKDASLSQEDKRAKVKEIREGTQAKVKEILTPEQMTKWQEHMKRNRPPGGPGGKPANEGNQADK